MLALMASATSWTYMHRILLPWEHYANIEHGRVRNNLSDLYPRWVGTRELLLHGKNPYGPEVSHEIQMGFYGHPIEQTYDKPAFEIIDEQRFAYPIYMVLLMAPTVHVPFETVDAWAPMVLSALTALGLWLWMQVLHWRPSPLLACALILFVLASPQASQALRLRQPALFVAFLIALATWCLTRNRLVLAGTLLAVATIKPHTILLVLIWFGIWCVGDWKRRWPLAAGFVGTLAALCGAGEFLLPSWPIDFLRGVVAYSKYFPVTSIVRLLMGDWLGAAVSVVAVAILIVFAWQSRGVAADSSEFIRILSLFLLSTVLLLAPMIPSNQVLLLLPFAALIRDWDQLPGFGRRAFAVLLAWPWILALILLAYGLRVDTMSRWALLPAALVLTVPFFILILCLNKPEPCPAPGRS
jgi:hypothetical protein